MNKWRRFVYVSCHRKLKNRETGVDMSVPSYETASSPKLVKDYHVVVITNLPYFKLPEHSEKDVVQFMVSMAGYL